MDPADIKVLIVDDEDMVCRMLRGFLEDQGFRIATALRGEDALELLTGDEFDAAIVDIRLPDMSGNDFILKANTIRPGTAFFVHTGSIDYALPEELVNIGMTEESVLHKPIIDMNEITQAILKKLE